MPILESIVGSKIYGFGNLLASGAFESIASASGTGSSGTITFSSIPSTYQSLQIRGIYRPTSGSGTVTIRVNSDSGNNYAYHILYGTGSAAGATGAATQNLVYTDWGSADTTYYMSIIADFHDYASTTRNKTIRIFSGVDKNGSGGTVALASGLWQSTSAITSISLIHDGSLSFNTATTFALYGIKGA